MTPEQLKAEALRVLAWVIDNTEPDLIVDCLDGYGLTAVEEEEVIRLFDAASVTLPGDDTVTIPAKEYEALQERARVLGLLERGGVDNWEWYGEALSGGFE